MIDLPHKTDILLISQTISNMEYKMKIIISPSKTMNYCDLQPLNNNNQSPLNKLTKDLLNTLNNLEYDSLKSLYKTSDKIIVEEIKGLSVMNYVFDEKMSSDKEYIFSRYTDPYNMDY